MRSHSRATKDRCGNIFDFFKEIYSIFKKRSTKTLQICARVSCARKRPIIDGGLI